MGQCESFCNTKNIQSRMNTKNTQSSVNINNGESKMNIKNRESLIKCTYLIKDYNETKIINDGSFEDISEEIINEEISKKIKIWNNGQKKI